MITFEIYEMDVWYAVRYKMNIDLTDEDALRILGQLDLQAMSDEAAFQSDGGDDADDDMDAATERAYDEIIRQIKTRKIIV